MLGLLETKCETRRLLTSALANAVFKSVLDASSARLNAVLEMVNIRIMRAEALIHLQHLAILRLMHEGAQIHDTNLACSAPSSLMSFEGRTGLLWFDVRSDWMCTGRCRDQRKSALLARYMHMKVY